MKLKGISDEAVLKATGKHRKQWFAILDKAAAKKMKHRDIAQFVYNRYLGKQNAKGGTNVSTSGGWWSQMITVEYERARGMRKVNEQANGFLVAVSKTTPGSVASLQKKWDAILKLPAVTKKKLERVPSKTKRAMLRYKADLGGVIVSFVDVGKGKTQVIIESIKLPKKFLVEPAREFWKKILNENV